MHQLEYRGRDGCALFAFSTDPLYRDEAAPRAVIVMMHGGGPDHRSLIPLAKMLSNDAVVILPDVRGYGMSRCSDPRCHTWKQYAEDVVALLDTCMCGRR